MSPMTSNLTAAVTSAGLLGSAYCAYYLYQKRKTNLPTTWTKVGTLQELYIYPIKSCKVNKVDSAECTIMGLRDSWLRDRFFMVIDESKNFITARVYPELYLVQPTVMESILTIQHNEMEDVQVNLAEVVAHQKPETATVWGIRVPVLDCGKEVNEWFNKLLKRSNKTFRLVCYADTKPRAVIPSLAKVYKFAKNDSGVFPDEISYHLINQSSVEELNTRLADLVISHHNFRPNFLIKGPTAYDEDKWKFMKIGDNIFEVIKPCTRCVMTTIDTKTGKRDVNNEPIQTLRTYRQIMDPVERSVAGNAPSMGINMALRSTPGGTVSINDDVYVYYK